MGVKEEGEKREWTDILPDLVAVIRLPNPGARGRIDGSGEEEKEYVVLQDIWNSQLLSGMLHSRGWVFEGAFICMIY